LAGRVALKIVYLLVRRVLGLAVLVFRTDLAKDAELLVVGAENLCHLGRCPTERRRFGQALGVGRAGLGSAGGGMIFGLWA
jgi:hypothetical protein